MLRNVLSALLFITLAWGAYAPRCLGDLQVNERKDIVILTDGTKIECNVVMVTSRGALVIIKEQKKATEENAENEGPEETAKQVLIPIHKIKKIIRGRDKGRTKGFQTDVEQARKVVKGTGFRKKKKAEEVITPDLPTGPIKKAELLLPSKVLKPGINQPVKNSVQTPKKLADAYLSRFPDIKNLAQTYLGNSSAVVQIFTKAQKGDPILHEQLKGVLDILLQDSPPKSGQGQVSAQPPLPKRPKAQKSPSTTPPPQPKTP